MGLPVAMLVAAAGCGDGMARVSGRVTLDGSPVVKTENIRCDVTLKPVAGGAAASGSVDESGEFCVALGSSESVPPGDYKASVRVREVTPSPTPGGYAKSRDLAAKRYASSATSGLTFTVLPGANELPIAVTSRD